MLSWPFGPTFPLTDFEDENKIEDEYDWGTSAMRD
jgi:hypothetical protein